MRYSLVLWVSDAEQHAPLSLSASVGRVTLASPLCASFLRFASLISIFPRLLRLLSNVCSCPCSDRTQQDVETLYQFVTSLNSIAFRFLHPGEVKQLCVNMRYESFPPEFISESTPLQ